MRTNALPPHELRITRAWPQGTEAVAGLLVEAEAPDGSVRAGTWREGTLELLPAGSDPKLSALAPLAADGTVVSHRYRRRAVVRVEGNAGAEFVKVVREGRSTAILAGIERARAFGAGFRMPEVLGSTPGTVRFSGLPGRNLHDADAFTPEEWLSAWEQVGRALVRTHETPGGGLTDMSRHGIDDEIGVLEMWRDRAAPWVTDPAGIAALVDDAAAALRALDGHGWVPTHRDLHDKQLLWDADSGPGLLDVDTACLAHPALDLGNLRAHARWRVLQGVWTPHAGEVVRDCVDAAAATLGVDLAALATLEQATLVRICCVYAFRPAHAGTARNLQAALLARRLNS